MIEFKTDCKNIETNSVEMKIHKAVFVMILMEVLRGCFLVFLKKIKENIEAHFKSKVHLIELNKKNKVFLLFFCDNIYFQKKLEDCRR